jgi:hypothetical protein
MYAFLSLVNIGGRGLAPIGRDCRTALVIAILVEFIHCSNVRRAGTWASTFLDQVLDSSARKSSEQR